MQLKADPKLVARDARERARLVSERVRYLRRLLGEAMAEETRALEAAREAERAER